MGNNRRRKTGGFSLVLFSAAVCLSLGATGCGNTLNGAKQDAATDTQKVATATDEAAAKTAAAARQAGQTVKDVPHNIDAATAVTPEVKAALVRDPVLNDPRNVINVDSHNHVTHLTGHVMTASMKDRATEDGQVVLAKRHPNYQISNELTVSGNSSTP